MKQLCFISLVVISLSLLQTVSGQGFVNLNFEDANVSGYSSGSYVPIVDAFPGWSVSYSNAATGTIVASSAGYDLVSLGGAVVSVNDANIFFGSQFINGNYSAFLFGGESPRQGRTSVTLSQTGLVPIGTKSLMLSVELALSGTPLIVSVDGQTISASQNSAYDISSFAGQIVTLSFTESDPGGVPPGLAVLDDITFTPIAVPEPGVLSLIIAGILFLCPRMARPNNSPEPPPIDAPDPTSRQQFTGKDSLVGKCSPNLIEGISEIGLTAATADSHTFKPL